jgi:DNA primase
VWLYKAGLSNDDIMRLGAYWHEPTGRVILPVYSMGRVVYWQGRDPKWKRGSTNLKYINPPVDKSHLCAKYGTGPVIALTEDILSAFRTSRATEAWSLMGTALAPGVLADLINDGRTVVVMLDPDSGGQKATDKIMRKLRAIGVPAYAASPHRDPKYLNRQELLSCLTLAIPQSLASQLRPL